MGRGWVLWVRREGDCAFARSENLGFVFVGRMDGWVGGMHEYQIAESDRIEAR
jgi:hypothetical protein